METSLSIRVDRSQIYIPTGPNIDIFHVDLRNPGSQSLVIKERRNFFSEDEVQRFLKECKFFCELLGVAYVEPIIPSEATIEYERASRDTSDDDIPF